MDLDTLDGERGGPFRILVHGVEVDLPPATDLGWQQVAVALHGPARFLAAVWPIYPRLEHWKVGLIQQAWIRHNGLPDYEQARRLIYMLDRWGDGIEYDLQHHLQVSMRELWQARRWRELLNYIDRLPTNSHKNRLLSLDEEYMTMIIKEKDKAKETPGAGHPSMAEWSQEAALLAKLIDAVRANTASRAVIASGGKGPKPSVEPELRPYSVASSVEYKIRKREHQSMVDLLLPGRKKSTG